MQVAFDLDNTIDAAPKQMQSLMAALKATGHEVSVVTGSNSMPVTQEDWQEKCNYLNMLGCGACWDKLIVLSHANGDIPSIKAKWCDDNGVDMLIDNSKENARAATAIGIPMVLVPWATRS
jgi:hypothetical protein